VAKTNKERVLDYLWAISPEGATNSEIRDATGIEPHQQVFQLTRKLLQAGLIRGVQGARGGNEWVFWAGESPSVELTSPDRVPTTRVGGELTSRAFEQLARSTMSIRLGVPLMAGKVPDVPKKFDMISPDGDLVGDAKYFTLVRGKRPPPAKFSNISEHVWLLEKTGAPTTFLVFGNQREVPELWLERYGDLASTVDFYFLTDEGELEILMEADE
jgi:hypothetical protein